MVESDDKSEHLREIHFGQSLSNPFIYRKIHLETMYIIIYVYFIIFPFIIYKYKLDYIKFSDLMVMIGNALFGF